MTNPVPAPRSLRNVWLALAAVLIGCFFLLGFYGREIYRQAPPIPSLVVTESGQELWTSETILDGQQAWQSMGGQEVGSIWGHGAYQAPDWSADWLHRESMALLAIWSARDFNADYEDLNVEQKGAIEARLRAELRTNRYDEESGTLTISDDRATAIAQVSAHYDGLFGGHAPQAELREAYALKEVSIPDAGRRADMAGFFFWTSWSCVTERPGKEYSYTNNWPHDPLVGNEPTATAFFWTMVSICFLLAGVGVLIWLKASRDREEEPLKVPDKDPLDGFQLTPSMRAVGKYTGVVLALFLVQVLLGAVLAHYTVEGQAFYGIPLAKYLPYALVRTWHLQSALFWIATAFLAFGLFLAPVIGGREPKGQALGVNVLFGALLLVVVGSYTGEYLSLQQVFGLDAGFWFGHQGYEYLDLGRFWQIALFGGLLLWLFLMARAIYPALQSKANPRSLTALLTGSVVAIGLLYGAGLFYGARTHLSVAEYWRWWVIHLWVEGFFEVFATAAVAFLFAKLGLIKQINAARATIASTAIFLVGGIPGTFHHLYFSGTPVSIMALGASFSALEVVPLVLIGFEAFTTLRQEKAAPWMRAYRWPIRFFVGVAFWNLVGAGIFGFLINPPTALYYMQGLNTTAVHGHAALFGVYGLLSLGLVLLILRRLQPRRAWKEGFLAYSFWAMNIGLGLMIGLSLLPIGLLQTYASAETGLWFARSAEFMEQPLVHQLRWMRAVGDTVFLSGVFSLVWWAIGLLTGRSYVQEPVQSSPVLERDGAIPSV